MMLFLKIYSTLNKKHIHKTMILFCSSSAFTESQCKTKAIF